MNTANVRVCRVMVRTYVRTCCVCIDNTSGMLSIVGEREQTWVYACAVAYAGQQHLRLDSVNVVLVSVYSYTHPFTPSY